MADDVNLGSGNDGNGGTAGGDMAAGGHAGDGSVNLAPDSNPATGGVVTPDPDAVSDMVNKLVSEQLAPIKSKLDSAFEERDAAKAEVSKLREAGKQAEIQRLQDDGKEVEALRLQHSELEGKYDALLEQNTKLSRDQLVDNAIAGLSFKNESAKRMAKSEIVGDLMKTEDGQWIHKSGVSVKDAVEVYSKERDKSFLFQPKPSSGAGSVQSGVGQTNVDNNAPYMTKAIGDLTTEEMMAAQNAGRFGEQKNQTWGF